MSHEKSDVASFEISLYAFREWLPEGSLSQIDVSQMPSNALADLDRRVPIYSDESGEVLSYWVIALDDGHFIYVTNKRKRVDNGRHEQDYLHFYELSEDGEYVGLAYTSLEWDNRDIQFNMHPNIAWIETRGGEYLLDTVVLSCRGYARRRLKAMNAVTQMMYRLPLYSGSIVGSSPASIKMWEHLIREGYATEVEKEGGERRYFRFLIAR